MEQTNRQRWKIIYCSNWRVSKWVECFLLPSECLLLFEKQNLEFLRHAVCEITSAVGTLWGCSAYLKRPSFLHNLNRLHFIECTSSTLMTRTMQINNTAVHAVVHPMLCTKLSVSRAVEMILWIKVCKHNACCTTTVLLFLIDPSAPTRTSQLTLG